MCPSECTKGYAEQLKQFHIHKSHSSEESHIPQIKEFTEKWISDWKHKNGRMNSERIMKIILKCKQKEVWEDLWKNRRILLCNAHCRSP